MNHYHNKTKPQLIEEIESLKNRVEELEQSEFKFKQAEVALQKSEVMFKGIFSQAPVGIELYDSKGNLINANQECLNIFGVGHLEEVEGFKLFDDPNISADAKTQLRNGVPVDYESEFDFEAVKKLKLYKTTKSGKCFLRVQITPYEISAGGEKGFTVHVQDITERKRAESQLFESKRMLNDVLNTIPVRVFWKDLDGVYLGCNQLFAMDAGRSNPEEMIGDNDYNMGWAEQAELYRSDDRSVIESGQPKINYEELQTTPEGKTIWLKTSKIPLRNSSGAVYGVLGTYEDITERKQAEKVVRENEEKLRNIVEYSTNLFFSHTPDHVLTYISPQTREFFDCEPEEALINWTKFVTDNPINNKGLKLTEEAIKTGERQPVYEFELVGKKGRKLWVEVSEAPIVENGKTVAIVGALIDITERKKAEEASRESEERYRTLTEAAQDAIFIIDREDNIAFVNSFGAGMFGKAPIDVIGKSRSKMFPPELAEQQNQSLQQVFKSGESLQSDNKTVFGKNVVWLSTRLVPLKSDTGEVHSVLGISRDITERKKVEQELRDSEYLLRESQKVAQLGSYELDALTGNWTSSKILDNIFGIDDNYIKKLEGWGDILHPDSREEMLKYFNENILKQHQKFDKMYRIIRINDGEERWVHGLGKLELDGNGNPVKMIGTIQDITKQKRSEEALQKSKERYRSLYQNTPAMLHSIDQEGRLTNVSKYWLKKMGYSLNEVLGHHSTDFMTEESSRYAKEVVLPKFYETSFCRDVPYQYVKKNGEIMETLLSAITEKDENGELIHSLSVIIDVTDRKQAEASLRESEARLRQVIDLVPHYIFAKDHKGRFILANSASAESMGTTPEEIIGKTELEIAPVKEEAQIFTKDDAEVISSGKPKFIPEGHFTDVKGKSHILQTIKIPFTASGTQNPSVLGVSVDITERKKAEEEIRKLSHSVEQSPAIVIITDTSGNIEYVNPKFEEVTGYTANEVIGKNPNILKSGKTTAEEYEILWKTIKAGGEWHGEFHNRKKNGEFYWESASISAIKDTKGQLTHYIAIKEDITGRKAMDKRLRESHNRLRSFAERLQMIREEERATIAREIHDDLGQSLTALKMDISWVKNNPEMDEEAKTAKFDMMLDLINSTIQSVKRIATELRPGILDDLGLVPAIEWQAAEFQNRFKIQCNVSINKSDVIIKDEISIAVFRIFQETLTNVARHSDATKVDIKLNFHVDNKLIMEIADNGVGIDEEQINSLKSLGLFGMRERVNILNGEMEIVGEHGKGTKVRVLIPVSIEVVENKK